MRYDLVFDNGGGITLQTEGYCHYYTDPAKAADDALELLKGDDPESWDGDEPACRVEYDGEVERNGGYRWVPSEDVAGYLETIQTAAQRREFLARVVWGTAMREFYLFLFTSRLGVYGCWDSEENTVKDCAESIALHVGLEAGQVARLIWDSWCEPPFDVEPYDENLGAEEWLAYCEFAEALYRLAKDRLSASRDEAVNEHVAWAYARIESAEAEDVEE